MALKIIKEELQGIEKLIVCGKIYKSLTKFRIQKNVKNQRF